MARTERLTIRLEPEEKVWVQRMAQKARRKDSDWARIVLLAGFEDDADIEPQQVTRDSDEITGGHQGRGASLDDVTETLVESIRNQEQGFRIGQEVPSTRDLAKTLGVSHQTVASAMSSLSDLGLIRRPNPGSRATVIATPEGLDQDPDLPCVVCDHAEGVHDGPEADGGPQCQICPEGNDRYHAYTTVADTEAEESSASPG
ncbi:GntR family transcriptional regulator [Streptomyces sp. 5-10]|uniref:GntR family transcriptional regulator n=1 Tax=Streptomyces sp. 5-10 TaxID=878925 RepID=UPI00168B77D3|nr:GntR family transcriptional regulator [Streptomyces sp. 5-10]MBD3004864.1 GntR family transcriptional regulator [Streptomyces sp. 5-10]